MIVRLGLDLNFGFLKLYLGVLLIKLFGIDY